MKKVFALFLILAGFFEIHAQPREISFFNIFDGTFSTSAVANISWMQDGEYYTTIANANRGKEIRKHSILTGEFEVLVTSKSLNEAYPGSGEIDKYQFSQNEEKLLLQTDVEEIWRRSSKADYYIYDIPRSEFKKLTQKSGKQQYADFSPQGDRAAFVRNNNIYWIDLKTGKEREITT
ncbi:MAG: DPP IV N-terminal domain-containing protein, partial [Balneolaceae bacterium]